LCGGLHDDALLDACHRAGGKAELEKVLEAAAQAGATSAFSIVLRLPWEVNPLFQDWLAQHFPDRAARVMARVREMRGGRDYDATFGTRMKGEGVWAELLAQRFQKAVARLGLNRVRTELDLTQFRPPRLKPKDGQRELFD
jgi:DNA repair photolyase